MPAWMLEAVGKPMVAIATCRMNDRKPPVADAAIAGSFTAMKSRDLSELLANRPIVHPTNIDGVAWHGPKLTITVRGFPWWKAAHDDDSAEGVIHFIFDGLAAGSLLTDEFDSQDDEALDSFEIQPVSEVSWAQGCDWSIYCSGPVPEPLALYAMVHDHLSVSDAFFRPEHYLNQAETLSRFLAMAQSSGYLIARVPTSISDLIRGELDRQGVPHNVFKTISGTEAQYLVRIGGSAFLCQNATAEFGE